MQYKLIKLKALKLGKTNVIKSSFKIEMRNAIKNIKWLFGRPLKSSFWYNVSTLYLSVVSNAGIVAKQWVIPKN